MQMPIPQSGARGSPFADMREGWFAMSSAAATLVPFGTRIDRPFTLMGRLSVMNYSGLLLKDTHVSWQ